MSSVSTADYSWPARYERLATDHGLEALNFPDAVALVSRFWAETRQV